MSRLADAEMEGDVSVSIAPVVVILPPEITAQLLRRSRAEVAMATGTGAANAVETVKEGLRPALETLDETMRQGRRFIVRGQHAVEGAAEATALRIRRRPLSAVMIAAGGGVLVGALIAWGLGRLARGRK